MAHMAVNIFPRPCRTAIPSATCRTMAARRKTLFNNRARDSGAPEAAEPLSGVSAQAKKALRRFRRAFCFPGAAGDLFAAGGRRSGTLLKQGFGVGEHFLLLRLFGKYILAARLTLRLVFRTCYIDRHRYAHFGMQNNRDLVHADGLDRLVERHLGPGDSEAAVGNDLGNIAWAYGAI